MRWRWVAVLTILDRLGDEALRGTALSRFPPMPSFEIDDDTLALLRRRVAKWHLNQRLGIERDYEARIFGQGRNFFHIENWYSIHSIIRGFLKLTLLHGRGRRNARTIEVRRNEFEIPGLPRAFDGYTLLHITDPHLDMAADIPHALIEAVRQVSYDTCVITGDFRAKTFGPCEQALDGMRQVRLHLNDDIYAVLGNHDSIRMVPALEDMGIRMLLNEALPLTRGGKTIYLAGIDDPHYYRADNLERASHGIPEGAVSILLAHSPEIYRHAAFTDFDIMLAGHTHGGQICLPGGAPLMCNVRCPRDLCNGYWTYERLQGYTSAGSGSCIVDVRFNCPPEITLHRLRCPRDGSG
jgi:predicted MPP superfamily phosphohydrolase